MITAVEAHNLMETYCNRAIEAGKVHDNLIGHECEGMWVCPTIHAARWRVNIRRWRKVGIEAGMLSE